MNTHVHEYNKAYASTQATGASELDIAALPPIRAERFLKKEIPPSDSEDSDLDSELDEDGNDNNKKKAKLKEESDTTETNSNADQDNPDNKGGGGGISIASTPCDVCEDEATKYCEQCTKTPFLCDGCDTSAHKSAKKKSHLSIPIEDHHARAGADAGDGADNSTPAAAPPAEHGGAERAVAKSSPDTDTPAAT